MQLIIHGQATEFRTIPRGGLFRFGHGEEIGTAIKTSVNEVPAAVMLYGLVSKHSRELVKIISIETL